MIMSQLHSEMSESLRNRGYDVACPSKFYLLRHCFRDDVTQVNRNEYNMPSAVRRGNDLAQSAVQKPIWEQTKEEQLDENYTVFNYQQLLEFAEGKVEPVFGPDFAEVDTYDRRIRLPTQEYLLIDKVTSINAEPKQFVTGSSITTELYLPINYELSQGGDIPLAVLVEAGQCEVMLSSYMGIDFQSKGKKLYRLLDTQLTFHGYAREGDTLKYVITVTDVQKKGGEIVMFKYQFDCFNKTTNQLILCMRDSAAGFFTEESLSHGKGIIRPKPGFILRDRQMAKTEAICPPPVSEFLILYTEKSSLDFDDMSSLMSGAWSKVLGPSYDLNYKISVPKMQMIDKITHIKPHGGVHGLGVVVGEKYLDEAFWCYNCHFKDDKCLAGSLTAEGCFQLLKVYMVWLGLFKSLKGVDFRFRPIDNLLNVVRCRGQIPAQKSKLVFVMEVKEIGYDEFEQPYAMADVDVVFRDLETNQEFDLEDYDSYGRGDMNKAIAVDLKNLGVKMVKGTNCRI